MKALIACTFAAALALAGSARGQAFVNLNFEQAQAPAGPTGLSFLDWTLAAPGWRHTDGADTGSVFYGTVHVGVTQWFALTSAESLPNFLLAGRYSFAFNSGYAATPPAGVPFVQATLSQTGTVPGDAQSLRLRALGPLAVYLDNAPIALQDLGGSLYGGDISAYAGQAHTLRLVNLSTNLGSPVAVDDIVFSPIAVVPEATTLTMFGGGLVGAIALRGLATARRRVGGRLGARKHGNSFTSSQ